MQVRATKTFAIGLVCVLCACTITQPIPEAAKAGYFSPLPPNSAASAVYLKVPLGTNLCVAVPTLPECFADHLGEVIDAVDKERLAYLNKAREVSNDNATYNALMYPFGAAAVYEKLRGAPNRKLLLPAVLAAGLYGFMNSGVPDREKQYLRAAAALQCAILRQAQYLYRRGEVEVDTAGPQPPAVLQTLDKQLQTQIDTFESARIDLLVSLQPAAPVIPLGPAGAIERRKSGGGGAAAPTIDLRGDVIQRTQDQLQVANKTLTSLGDLRSDIRFAAWRLVQDVQSLSVSIQKDLSDKVPAPKDPFVIAKDFRDRAVALAQAGEQDTPLMDAVMPADKLKRLDAKSAKTVLDFAKTSGVPLKKDWAAAQRFLGGHKRVAEQAEADRQALGCGDRLPTLPVVTTPSSPASGQVTTKPL